MFALQKDISDRIARDEPLVETADALCLRVEELLPGVICSIVTVDSHNRLHPLAGPSLPDKMRQAFEGLSIGPYVGACGTAIYRKVSIQAPDIATDPCWTHYASLPLSFGLKGCWSTPIIDADGEALGALAFYFHEVRLTTDLEAEVMRISADLCLDAMEQDRRAGSRRDQVVSA